MTLRRTLAIILSLSLALLSAISVSAQEPQYQTIEDPLFGVTSVVPADWQSVGSGQYARSQGPEDIVSIAIQSVAASIEDLWPSILPALALTEPPAPSFDYYTDLYEWTVHEFTVELGEMTLAFGLALSEQDGSTNLVLMQSHPEEYDALREQVLKPAIDAFAPLAPEPTPDSAGFAYDSEEVAFPGGAEGVELAGTLTLPSGPGPHPVVITMTGSGPQDRNESLKPITTLEPFAVLADALTSAGVGVLRYDDRGVGGSTGDYGAATVQDLAEDARAAIDYLETRDDVDPQRIGLFGHSEGGLYAAMLGASDPRVAWIGMMAPGVIDGIKLLIEQNIALARTGGSSEELSQAIGEYTAEVLPVVLAGDFDEVERISLEFFGRLWDELTPEERELAGEREAFARARVDLQMPSYTSDWYRSFLGYDPTEDWVKVSDVPVLAIFAGKDVQVIAESNRAALEEALSAAGNEDVTTMTFDDANHLFQEAATGAFSEYGELEPELIDGFVEAVVDWTVERAGVAE